MKCFERWIYIFGKEILLKSNQYPLVSGFYKLLTICMKMSEKCHYFDSIDNVYVPRMSWLTVY